MITDNEILTKLYKIVNIPAVTSVIDGKVYKGERPIDSKRQDIVLQCLVNESTNNDRLQKGYLNINCFCEATPIQTRDSVKLNEIAKAVLTSLNLDNGIGSTGIFTYQLESSKTFRSQEDPKMFFTNIKLKFAYKN